MATPNAKPARHADAHTRDRAFMVARHLEARGIFDPLVLTAMGKVPREAFVSEPLKEFAYEDSALPIEAGQTISQPYIVARMIELAELRAGDKVLEVGAGSGYAAAVMSRIAGKVYAIERHEELAAQARARLKGLGYDNAEIICADGTKGLPEHAPFNAIVVSAGGPRVPEALKRQLAVGGRLVIPVGRGTHQTLLRVHRTSEDDYIEEDFGGVTFVPLIGEEGWAEPAEAKKETKIDAETSGYASGLLIPSQRAKALRTTLSHLIAEAAEPFGDLSELAGLAERFAGKRVVLLGEATHGTAEFYDARAAITERLVAEHGFNIVAVEADWPDAAIYDAYVRGLPRPTVPKAAFTRFPTWMWRNGEVAAFLRRLKDINDGRASRPALRLLRPRRLQPLSLDRGGAALSRQSRSRGSAASRASATAVLRRGAPSRSATGAWRCHAAMRCARSRSPTRCSISCTSGSIISSGTARTSSPPSRTRASSRPPSNITASCIMATPCRGICATSICSTRSSG